MQLKKAFSIGLPLCVLLVSVQQAGAQNGVTTSRTTVIESSSSSGGGGGGSGEVSSEGVMGVKSSNKKAYNYPKLVVDYKEQISKLTDKGLLTSAKAEEFKTRLAGLEQLTKDAEAKKWPESVVADLDKKFTAFNADLSRDSQPKVSTPAKTPPITKVAPTKEQPKTGKKQPTSKEPKVESKLQRPTDKQGFMAVPTPAGNSIGSSSRVGKVDDAYTGSHDFFSRRPNVGGGDSKPSGAAGKGK